MVMAAARFEEAYEKWLSKHKRNRKGELRSRLERGHGHAERMFLERVWWPIFETLDNLHPEFEVLDWRGNPFFVDFAWVNGPFKFVFEIKGYGPHVQNTDRIRYRRELNRETYLQVLGYRVVSIPYDELEEKPQLIVSLIRSLISPYSIHSTYEANLPWIARKVLMVALRKGREPIRPVDVMQELRINRRTAVKQLKLLCDQGRLQAVESGDGIRVVKYTPSHSVLDHWQW